MVLAGYHKFECNCVCKSYIGYGPTDNHMPNLQMRQELQDIPMTYKFSHPPCQLQPPPMLLDHIQTVDTTSSTDRPERDIDKSDT